MRKLSALLMILALLLSCFGIAEGSGDIFTKDIYVLYTSDIHCGINSGFGLVGVDAIRDNLAKDNYVLLVDNGDAIHGEPIGTMTKGEAITKLMNAMQYDIATLGNHEFDYGMDRMMELIHMADFPYISCNFCYNGIPVLDPYVIKEFDGVKIAFVGITTPLTLTTSSPKYFKDENGEFVYTFCQDEDGTLLYQTVQNAVDAARAEGAQYVVAMAHLGNEAAATPYCYADVIANTNGIDVMLDGHSHDTEQLSMKNKDGVEVMRTACGTKLQSVGYIKIAKDGTFSTGLYTWGDTKHNAQQTFGFDNDISDAIEEAENELSEALKEVVGVTNCDLYINDPTLTDENGMPVRIVRSQETNFGDLVADALRSVSGADIAVINGGAIRTTISAGQITRNDILSAFPFGNNLCVVEVTGQQLLDALEYSVHAMPSEFGGFLQVSGINFEVHMNVPSTIVTDTNDLFVGINGEYRVQNVTVGGVALDLEKTYTLASTDYVLMGNGNGYTQFDGCKTILDGVMLDNQAVLTYISETLGGTVGEEYSDPYGDGRIVIIDAE